MQDNKFTFSQSELQLISDKDFFIQKSIITKKLIVLFHELNEEIEKIKSANEKSLPQEALKIAGKISKGENYSGLPYLVSDNPRVFNKKNIFAYRSMFWWGNYFSFTLHLSGKHLESYQKSILRNFEKLKEKDFLICIHAEQWIHHLEKENYESLYTFDKKKIESIVKENKFLKLSRKLEFKDYEQIIVFGIETFREYLSLIKS